MIAYFDTSAVVPLAIDEPTTPACLQIWNDATVSTSARILFAESCAALGRARRAERIERGGLTPALNRLGVVMAQIGHVEIDARLVATAGSMAIELGLRGYDAVHLAAALSIADDETVFVTGDQQLAHVASEVGLAVVSTAA